MPGKTKRFFISVSLLVAVLLLQGCVYYLFIRPAIISRGATEREFSAAMPGDELAASASSTRAINIAAPPGEVWKWLAQLGSDRGGFYSYDFLENLGGEPLPKHNRIVPEFQPMPPGRYVPAWKPDAKGKGGLGWKLVAVEKGKYFVLEGWGCFRLTPMDGGRTRLVVRTHGKKAVNFLAALEEAAMVPLHYLMERKMMLGIRDLAEASGGVNTCGYRDIIWFAAIVVSGIGIALFTFMVRGLAGFVASNILGSLWLVTLFILPPQAWYGLALLLLVSLALAVRIKNNSYAKQGRRFI